MSSRPLLKPQSVITNGSMAGSLTSLVTIINQISIISYAVSWAGSTPVGTMSVQVSDDYSQNGDGTVRNSGTWNTLPINTMNVSGNTGNGFIDIYVTGAYAIRLLYTRSSGTGTMNATISGKVS